MDHDCPRVSGGQYGCLAVNAAGRGDGGGSGGVDFTDRLAK